MTATPKPPPQASDWRAVLAAATGSSLVGTVPMLAVGLYAQGMDVVSLLFWRYGIALLVLWPLAAATSANLGEDWRRGGRGLFLNGITLGVLQTFTYFRAVQTLPSSVVVTLFFTYPMLTLAIDRFIFGKRIAMGSVIAVSLIFIGAALAGWPSLRLDGGDPVGLACALATPLGFAAYIAIAYRFTLKVSPFAGAASIYSGLGCGYALIAAGIGLKFPVDSTGWLSLLSIGIIGGVIQISSFAYALPRLSSSGYSIIVSMELVTVVLLGVLVLGEVLSPLQAAGVALVAVGIVTDRLARAKA
ncbi:MAG: DMT family transporter [Hyphomicrobiaceae bacterium]